MLQQPFILSLDLHPQCSVNIPGQQSRHAEKDKWNGFSGIPQALIATLTKQQQQHLS